MKKVNCNKKKYLKLIILNKKKFFIIKKIAIKKIK